MVLSDNIMLIIRLYNTWLRELAEFFGCRASAKGWLYEEARKGVPYGIPAVALDSSCEVR